ncbi:MAG: aminodeoxychorismate lyase, partial [Bacteroidetes bacterium]|nr:aminodeoxychorismate lyase [Bacteroidota bacterium]
MNPLSRHPVLSGGLVLIVAALLGMLWVLYGPNRFEGAEQKLVTVSRGETFREIVDSLETQQVIRSRAMFEFAARVLGGTDRIQVGRYAFQQGASNASIFLTLRDGTENMLIPVSVPEGTMARTQARIYRRAVGIDSAAFMRLAFDPAFARSLGIDAPTLEGYLLPDTYHFYWQQDERDIVRTMVSAFLAFYGDSLQTKTQAIGWSMHRVVTMASIVEGEAVLDEERPIVAGVYLNRLRLRMRLEADPTIQYVIPGGPRRLLYSDLRVESPYNTYRHYGLPPGPVNNP